MWNLKSTPDDTIGVQQNIGERLQIRMKTLIENTPANATFKMKQKIRVKLSGDGTNVGKRLHLINFTFTLLDEGDKAMAAEGNHIIAIVKVPENYSSLSTALRDIRNEIASLNNISIGTHTFDIEWFLGGDWTFLACCEGLGAAISTYPCIWCKCPLYDKYEGDKEWSLSDPTKGARTVQEIEDMSKKTARKQLNYNCKNVPLFPEIPLDHVIIDSLHLFLRISDNLINLLILELRRQDAIDKKKVFNDGFDRAKYKHMVGFEKYLNQDLHISFNWFICKDSKKLKWRDLTGPEKVKLFQNMDISKLLPNFEKSTSIQQLWDGFKMITDVLSSSNNSSDFLQFQDKVKAWTDLFTSLYQTKHITPYMHALLWHVPELINLHGPMSSFKLVVVVSPVCTALSTCHLPS